MHNITVLKWSYVNYAYSMLGANCCKVILRETPDYVDEGEHGPRDKGKGTVCSIKGTRNNYYKLI